MGNNASTSNTEQTSLSTYETAVRTLQRTGALDLHSQSLEHISTALLLAIQQSESAHGDTGGSGPAAKMRFNFAHNRISTLPSMMFGAFFASRLVALDLSFNRLRELPPAIGDLASLQQLWLMGNPLQSLPDELRGANQLQLLDIRSTRIGGDLPNCITALSSLSSLMIGGLSLRRLPQRFEKLTALKALNAADCGLRELLSPAAADGSDVEVANGFARMVHLTEVSLQRNALTSIPNGFFHAPSVVSLDASFNRLSSIPSEIGLYMTKLTKLNIRMNALSELPNEISLLVHLHELDASHNRITILPDGIGQLTRLSKLYLHSNRLHTITDSLSALQSSLQTLVLAGNALRSFPAAICALSQLTNLSLGFNAIGELPSDISCLTRLATLNMAANELTQLPEALFTMTRLERLHLGYNRLHRIDDNITRLAGLRELSLWGNEISEWPAAVLHSALSQLRVVDLSMNRIAEVPEALAPTLQQMATGANVGTNDTSPLSLPPIRELHLHGNGLSFVDEAFARTITGNSQPVTDSLPLTISVGVAEMTGKRPHMEDAVSVNFDILGANDSTSERVHCLALFDGHGGSNTSSMAANEIPALLQHHISRTATEVGCGCRDFTEDVWRHVFESVATDINAIVRQREFRDGCTMAVALIINDSHLVAANLADSRAVLAYRNDAEAPNDRAVLRLTKDHRVADAEERERIEALGGTVINNRIHTPTVNGLSVSRALGDIAATPFVSIEPFVSTTTLSPLSDGQQRVLIVACDGFWDEASDDTAAQLALDGFAERQERRGHRYSYQSEAGLVLGAGAMPLLSAFLRDYAYACQSSDNISVIACAL